MTFKTALLGLAAALGIASASSAATVTFDFSAASSGNWANSLSYTVGGVGLTVTGADTTGASGKVQTWAGAGLGMKSATDCTLLGICYGMDHQIDTEGRDDIVKFLFSQAVKIKSIAFNYVDPGDMFNFLAGGSTQFTAGVSSVVAINSALGTNFGVGAAQGSKVVCALRCTKVYTNSAFKLKSITIETAAVPVPAAGLVLVGGLGALGLVRRRRKAA